MIKIDLVQVRQKRTNSLTNIFHRSSPKSIGFLRKYIQMYVCRILERSMHGLFWLFVWQKKDFGIMTRLATRLWFFLEKALQHCPDWQKDFVFFSQKFWCQCPDLQLDFEFFLAKVWQLYPDVQQACFHFSSKTSSDTAQTCS